MNEILRVENLTLREGLNTPVNNISFTLKKHECLGIIGQSGSGKSLICKAIMGICESNLCIEGKIEFKGINLLNLNDRELSDIRGKKIFFIPQNPMSALDPLYKIKELFSEGLECKDPYDLLISMLKKTGFKDPVRIANSYPYELSGGQLQRIIISMALAQNPQIIIADEPTSALDAITAKEILNIFKYVNKELKTSLIFVSHDLGAVSYLSDEILLMRASNLIELKSRDEFFNRAQNSYTKQFIATYKELFAGFNKCFG